MADPDHPTTPPPGLAEVARDYKRGVIGPKALFDAFIAARLWSPAPPKPGVHLLSFKGERVVPVFSSEAELAKFMGRTKWFSTTGLDLLTLLPKGVTIGLDMASPHRLQLDPAAVRLEYALVLPTSGSGPNPAQPSTRPHLHRTQPDAGREEASSNGD